MNGKWLIVAVLGAGLLAGAEEIASTPSTLRASVAFVFVKTTVGEVKSVVPDGTGFFMTVDNVTSPGKVFTYFVTARHVLQPRTEGPFFPEIELRVNLKNGESIQQTVPLVLKGEGRNVFLHTDPTVDAAVIQIGLTNIVQAAFVPAKMLTAESDLEKLHITEGSDVFFTGMLGPYYVGKRRNYPVVRFGKVALITPELLDGVRGPTQLIVMEATSFPGNSGSPVFYSLLRQPATGLPLVRLAGVMSGAIIQAVPGYPATPGNTGLAAVVPAQKISEILFSRDLLERRRTQTGATVTK